MTVVSATVDGKTLTIVGTAQQRTTDGYKGDVKTFTFKVQVAANYNCTIEAGDTFSTTGYQYVENSGEITILKYLNIVFNN